jgi:hypothetical protein
MERVIDFLLSIIRLLVPCWPVMPWEGGVRTTAWPWFGTTWKEIRPGLVWKWPLVGAIWTINVKRQTVRTFEQEMRTRDGVYVGIRSVITYSVKHPHKVFIEVQDWDSALIERAMVYQAAFLNSHELRDCTLDAIHADVGPKVRREGFRWGCEIEDYGVVDFAELDVHSIHGVGFNIHTA